MQAAGEMGSWTAGGHAIRIEYSASVLAEIRAAAVEGLCRFRRGGIEIGGILFGTTHGATVRILAFRPVPCQYASGPSYLLSDGDQQLLAQMLELPKHDPILEGLVPVGWYHSHTRSGVSLSAADLEIHRRYFRQPWQVALVVQPEPFGSARAGFFFREADGSIHAEASYAEFVLAAPAKRRAAGAAVGSQEPEAKADRQITAPSSEQNSAVEAVKANPTTAATEETTDEIIGPAATGDTVGAAILGRIIWAKWVIAGVCACLIAGAAFAWYLHGLEDSRAAISLRLQDAGGQLQIIWDKEARPILDATGAILHITDGGEGVNLRLDEIRLRHGSVYYVRRSGNVEVAMHVYRSGRPPVEEVVDYLGAAPQAQPPAPSILPDGALAASVTLNATKPFKPVQPAASQRSVTTASSSSLPSVRHFDLARLSAIPEGPAVTIQDAPPDTSGVSPDSREIPAGPFITPAIPAPPPIKPEARPPISRIPTSGRLMWRGHLAKGEALAIDGQRVSSGVLSGEFPGRPIRVNVHPAQLTGSGLAVFTSDASDVGGAEAPTAQNDWHSTAYEWNPGRANSLLVIEPPGPVNNWKRLVVRTDNAAISTIVIDWKSLSTNHN